MRRSICGLAGLLTLALPVVKGTDLTLESVLQRAAARASAESTRVAIARGNLKYLDTQSKTRVELRPQLGLLSFTNPALLATSLGSSLFINRQAPNPFTVQNAKFDEMDAEVAADQAGIQAQIEAGRRFFEALEKRQIHDELERLMQSRYERQKKGAERTAQRQATRINQARLELSNLDLERQLDDAAVEYETALVSLESYIGLDAGGSSGVRLVAPPSADLPDFGELPAATELVRIALEQRPELQVVRDSLDEMRYGERGPKRARMDSLSLGFARVGEAMGNALGYGSSGYLLGGNTGTANLGLTIRLRDTGEGDALTALSDARVRSLSVQIRQMEEAIGLEVRTLHSQILGDAQRINVAQRKVALLEEIQRAMETRHQAGLESTEAVQSIEVELIAARSELHTAQGESESRKVHLLTACGFADTSRKSWSILLARRSG